MMVMSHFSGDCSASTDPLEILFFKEKGHIFQPLSVRGAFSVRVSLAQLRGFLFKRSRYLQKGISELINLSLMTAPPSGKNEFPPSIVRFKSEPKRM
ncbi:hypothetical protein CEXT_166661 [Caerostris extrusa]|uniref:Uncharacterized protein n=1 Tax=Caerostris extrusa TaxID=172846 RepID=A0AAV4SWS5_CAEEX|nr:hypothetical protein CEXT_166661 [Caerostris extrusa]